MYAEGSPLVLRGLADFSPPYQELLVKRYVNINRLSTDITSKARRPEQEGTDFASTATPKATWFRNATAQAFDVECANALSQNIIPGCACSSTGASCMNSARATGPITNWANFIASGWRPDVPGAAVCHATRFLMSLSISIATLECAAAQRKRCAHFEDCDDSIRLRIYQTVDTNLPMLGPKYGCEGSQATRYFLHPAVHKVMAAAAKAATAPFADVLPGSTAIPVSATGALAARFAEWPNRNSRLFAVPPVVE